MTDEQIAAAQPTLLSQDIPVQIGPIRHILRRNTPLYSRDFAVLRILQDNLGRRPVAWSLTTGGDFYGLEHYVLQQGYAMALQAAPVDTTLPTNDTRRLLGAVLDVPTTERLAWDTYRHARLAERGKAALEPTAEGVSRNLALPFLQLGIAYEARGDREMAIKNLTRAGVISPRPELQAALLNLLAGGDSAATAPRP
jgi:tetratricopeptide (TPR) repeat protein